MRARTVAMWPTVKTTVDLYVYDNNRLMQWFLFRHSRSSMQPQYADRMRSLPRPLPSAAIAEPTKIDNTEVEYVCVESLSQGLTDGGVIIFERQESEGKWGTSPSAKNGDGLSSIPWVKQVRLIKNK
ncbi:hypothetical protein Tco_0784513, partial [Tanacetum coccineum]